MDRWVVWWAHQPRWWKGFYLTLGIAFPLFMVSGASVFAALFVSGTWAVMVLGALWLSEKLKDRWRRW